MSGSQQLLLGETGGASAAPAQFVEQIYGTFVYTGNGSTQIITNGINYLARGGLIWFKSRNNLTFANAPNCLTDSVTGLSNYIFSNGTSGQQGWGGDAPIPQTYGFNLPINGAVPYTNYLTGNTYVSWTFGEQSKFFDIVTLNSSTTTYNHNLGSTPGCILVKCTNAGTANWVVYHQNLPSPTTQYLTLNTAGTTQTFGAGTWSTSSTQFSVAPGLWADGTAGVAYLFANNAGGYGTLGTDSIVYCGVFSSTGQVNIGFEPQWIFTKATSISTSFTGDWRTFDVIRGIYAENDDPQLFPNTNGAENSSSYGTAFTVNATGFVVESQGYNGSPVVYVAIRRGPMAVPTIGTSVYSQVKYTGDGVANRAFTTGFPVDSNITKGLTGGGNSPCLGIRKTDGMGETNATSNPYQNLADWIGYDNNTQLVFPGVYQYNNNTSYEYLSQSFGRAPKFHDVQTWIGTGSNLSINHNLEIPPELIIIKNRSLSSSWVCYNKTIGNTRYMELQSTNASAVYPYWQGTTPTSTQFFVGTAGEINGSSNSMQAWMFATCPGVSMVGTYTGTGGAQTINCGFTTGARYVMIKRTDSTGGWCVFSTAMGMSSGTSPYYFMNSNVNYVTGVDYINTTAVGFNITSTAFAQVNDSGGNFIFLAIA
tara:strand:- start:611 stop:2560 length:1950 start_codon:yes stop_codon:yes gene_type:complete